MSNILIQNESDESDAMILCRLGLLITGDKTLVRSNNTLIRTKKTMEGDTLYVVQNIQDKNEDKSWKDAAEGLAKYIEDNNL